VITEKENIS